MFTRCVLMLRSIPVGSLDVFFSSGLMVLISLTLDISFSLIGCAGGIHMSVLSVGCLHPRTPANDG
jgi:hypothetical protein